MAVLPKVSIITPTHNHEAYIGACIESVLAQTFENWEMLIVDDGSTDATADVVLAFKDPRIRLIRQPNQGLDFLGETYNKALSKASGELVAILEGDDYWPIYKLDLQVRDFAEDGVVLSSGVTAIVDETQRFICYTPGASPPEWACLNRPVGIAAKLMMDPESLTFTFPVSTIVRKDALVRIGGFQQPKGLPLVDLPTFLRLTLEGEFRFHVEVCGFWRRHMASTTKSRFPQILEGAYEHCFDFIRSHRDRLPMSHEELDAIELKWEYYQSQLCILRGRVLSASKRFEPAKRAYSETRRYRRTKFADAASRLSTLLSVVHLPSEWIYRLRGWPAWRKLVEQPSGDLIVSEEDLARPRQVHRWRESG
jgi:GT2 family glycosyltransferase